MKPLTYREMEARDLRAELEHDGREDIPQSPCPCGKPVVDVYIPQSMVGGRNQRPIRYYHSRERYCEFPRRF